MRVGIETFSEGGMIMWDFLKKGKTGMGWREVAIGSQYDNVSICREVSVTVSWSLTTVPVRTTLT